MQARSWKELFSCRPDIYEHRRSAGVFIAEANFIADELKLAPGSEILDIGCGTGLHAVELAKKGFKVTGVDYSGKMIEAARNNAEAAGVKVDLICAPAQNFVSEKRYDAAISIHEGALCLLENNECPWRRDMAVLGSISDVLKPGGLLLITVLNGLRLIHNASDNAIKEKLVNLTEMTALHTIAIRNDLGERAVCYDGIERFYTPSELVRMLNRIKLSVDSVYGAAPGLWKRQEVNFNDIELMIKAHKK